MIYLYLLTLNWQRKYKDSNGTYLETLIFRHEGGFFFFGKPKTAQCISGMMHVRMKE